MRVRDLRWYILACIILIASYAGIAICFYLSISNGKVESSMKELGLKACENEVQLVEDKLDEFLNDDDQALLEINQPFTDIVLPRIVAKLRDDGTFEKPEYIDFSPVLSFEQEKEIEELKEKYGV